MTADLFGADAPKASGEGEIYFCFKPSPAVIEQVSLLVLALKAEGLVTRVRPPDTLHVSIASVGPYQDVREIAARASAIADCFRGKRFTFEISQLLPFGGPTAVLAPMVTPASASDLQRNLALGTQRPGFKPKVGLNAHMTIAYTDVPITARRLDRVIMWPVTDFFLILSRPNIGHEELGSWPLT